MLPTDLVTQLVLEGVKCSLHRIITMHPSLICCVLVVAPVIKIVDEQDQGEPRTCMLHSRYGVPQLVH